MKCRVRRRIQRKRTESFFFFVDLFSVFPFFVFVTGCSGSLSGRVPFKARWRSLRQMVWSAWTWPVILRGLQGDVEGSDDAVLGQLMQLQVIEGLPGANDGDVCNRNTKIWGHSGHCKSELTQIALHFTHLCLSPPYQGYRHQSCKEKRNYKPSFAVISKKK